MLKRFTYLLIFNFVIESIAQSFVEIFNGKSLRKGTIKIIFNGNVISLSMTSLTDTNLQCTQNIQITSATKKPLNFQIPWNKNKYYTNSLNVEYNMIETQRYKFRFDQISNGNNMIFDTLNRQTILRNESYEVSITDSFIMFFFQYSKYNTLIYKNFIIELSTTNKSPSNKDAQFKSQKQCSSK